MKTECVRRRAVVRAVIVVAALSADMASLVVAANAASPAGREARTIECQSRYVRDPSVWRTPPIRPQGFQFEVQLSSYGKSYEIEKIRQSIREHDLGEYESALAKTMAAEWGYSFTHLDGQLDGAGRRIQAGYAKPPADRAECLRVIEAFLQRQYIQGAAHPWASMNGHYPWQHYAGEFGFEQIGSEIGENINSYQWHIALTRGAARQYGRPWFIDFSAWHGPSITDYSEGKIWGENSGPDHGHSLSLFERTLFMSYMAGASQITAEAGGAISFLPVLDEQGRYRLSPYGKVCKRLREFTLAHPDVGVPLAPIGIVLDFHHGAYPGFEKRQVFGYFDYTAGDQMTWDLIDLIWPGGWEVMGKNEVGAMVSTPFGDSFDVLLQNAPQKVLNSYPGLVLSGDVKLSAGEVARYIGYVQQGGTLILNRVFLRDFPAYMQRIGEHSSGEVSDGKGRVIVYGPEFRVEQLGPLLRNQLVRLLPVEVKGDVEYLVNCRGNSVYVTLINNKGVTKAPRAKAVVDESQATAATVVSRCEELVKVARDIKNNRLLEVRHGNQVAVTIPAGGMAIVELDYR